MRAGSSYRRNRVVQEIVEQLALVGLLGLLVKLTLWAQPETAESGELWERQAVPALPLHQEPLS